MYIFTGFLPKPGCQVAKFNLLEIELSNWIRGQKRRYFPCAHQRKKLFKNCPRGSKKSSRSRMNNVVDRTKRESPKNIARLYSRRAILGCQYTNGQRDKIVLVWEDKVWLIPYHLTICETCLIVANDSSRISAASLPMSNVDCVWIMHFSE